MNIQDYYKYSWFSTLAYVDWRNASGLTTQESIEDAASAERLPNQRGQAQFNQRYNLKGSASHSFF